MTVDQGPPTSQADPEIGEAISRRIPHRIAFVVALALLGAVVGLLIASTVRAQYRATVPIDIAAGPERTAAIAEWAHTVNLSEFGDVSMRSVATGLEVEASADLAEQAQLIAQGAAETVSAHLADPTVTVASDRIEVQDPEPPDRSRWAGLGAAIGALVGLVLQTGLVQRPSSDEFAAEWFGETIAVDPYEQADVGTHTGFTSAIGAEPSPEPDPVRPDELAAELAQVKAEIGETEARLAGLRADRAKAERELDATERELAESRVELAELRAAPADPEDDIAYLRDQNDLIVAELDRYRELLESERIDSFEQITEARLTAESDRATQELEHRHAIDDLTQKLQRELHAERERSEAAIGSLVEAHEAQLEELVDRHDAQLRKERARRGKDIKLAAARGRENQRKSDDDELAAMRQALTMAEASLAAESARLERARTELAEKTSQADRAQPIIDRLEAERHELARRVETETKALRNRLEHAERRLTEERKRSADIAKRLLDASAATAAQADRQQALIEQRGRDLARQHSDELAALRKQATDTIAAATAREAQLEATIAQLKSSQRA